MSARTHYDCIVIGGGHAGIEAALASSRMGAKTLLMTMSLEGIGQMSCNPAIGGVGKGQLVKEIDALGGEMGKAADATAIQFRQLNASKGQAVRSSRCQSDRKLYARYMQKIITGQKNLDVFFDIAGELLVIKNHVKGITTESGNKISAKAVVISPGTFLSGRMHVGPVITSGGRFNEPASVRLSKSLERIGFPLVNFKTGTPPRLDGKTINYKKLEIQHSDNPPVPFSFTTKQIPKSRKLLPCFITHTNKHTHAIIKANLHKSPMYAGQIEATGVRYCPSIEDKLKKFPDKGRHQIFLEPEGLDTDIYYPNGISTGLPAEIQEAMVHTIQGLENVVITRYGYAIEHLVVPPTEIKHNLETKRISGLFLAGQINGTTGYEEAAAQGLMAGINAILFVRGQEPFVLKRDEAYIGVLIDDLVTKGTEEPYRMFTTRVEYRLIVREDNADKRLCGYGYKLGLIRKKDYENVCKKYQSIEKEIRHLKKTKIMPGTRINNLLKSVHSSPLKQPASLSDILKRPGVTYRAIASFDGNLKKFPQEIIEQIEYEIKYEGFIVRQLKDVERFKYIENIRIPLKINYDAIHGLSTEIKEKLKRFLPRTLGQALRISGVTPTAISILMIYLKKQKRLKTNKNKKKGKTIRKRY